MRDRKFEAIEFLNFARRYVGLLAVIVSIPLLSQIFRVLPIINGEFQDNTVLSILSSFICLLTFGGAFMVKGLIYRLQNRHPNIASLLLFSIVFLTISLSIYLTANHLNNYNEVEVSVFNKVATYLSIFPLLVFALAIVLLSAYNLEEAYKIQNIISSELSNSSPEIVSLLNSFSDYKMKSETDKAFRDIGEEILLTSNSYIENLGDGIIEVSGRLTPDIQRILASYYNVSFQAVSYRDLNFWTSMESNSIANMYLQLNIDSKNRGVDVNRLFIFNREDVIDDYLSIYQVLRHQNSMSFGFSIMMEEEMDHYGSGFLQSGNLDFALFNGDQAITYFRSYRENKRQFRAVFNVDEENKIEIQRQLQVYKTLIAKCWLFNDQYLLDNKDILSSKVENSDKIIAQILNETNYNLVVSISELFPVKSKEIFKDFWKRRKIYDELNDVTYVCPVFLVNGAKSIKKDLHNLKSLVHLINDYHVKMAHHENEEE